MSRARQWKMARGLLVVGVLACASGTWAADEAPPSSSHKETPLAGMIQDHMAVQLEYTLTSDGAVVDSTEGRGPLQYVHGQGQIIPGLERQLTGLHVGDAREITVRPEEAYGPVDPSAFVEIPKTQLPPNVTPAVGVVLRGMDPDGKPFRATIHEVKDKAVTLDLNHPLAGKTLLFKVKVIDVSPAPAS